MRTQTVGESGYFYCPLDCNLDQTQYCTAVDEAQHSYLGCRSNGNDHDSPPTSIPLDGTCSETRDKERLTMKYTAGLRDAKWMAERDRNYLARLFLSGACTTQEQQDLKENTERAEKDAEEVKKLAATTPTQLSPFLRDYFEREQKAREEKTRQEEKLCQGRSSKEKAEREGKDRLAPLATQQRVREVDQEQKKREANEKVDGTINDLRDTQVNSLLPPSTAGLLASSMATMLSSSLSIMSSSTLTNEKKGISSSKKEECKI